MAVELLEHPDQRFRCVPGSAILRAWQCVQRQKDQQSYGVDYYRGADGRRRTYKHDKECGRPSRVAGRTYLGKCRDCELGRQVAARLEG